MADCLFCKIASKEVDAAVRFESDQVVAFDDINPAAPFHVLVIPKRHIRSARELTSREGALLAELFDAIGELAKDARLADGYRVVTNIGPAGGQTVDHLHLHVIGGRQMQWPPG